MELIDFIYDGKCLSDFGFMVAFISNDISTSTIQENTLSANQVRAVNSDRYYATSYDYDASLTFPAFDIMKINCSAEIEGSYISDKEYHSMVRWLSRKACKKFVPIYRNGEFPNIYYEGYFNIMPVIVGAHLVGINLTLSTNSPYAFENATLTEYELLEDKLSFYYTDSSDEYGINYCDKIVIKMYEDCDFCLSSDRDMKNDIVIKNCKKNEEITIENKTKIITSNYPEHTSLANDFNYNYFRFVNTFDGGENKYTCSNPCHIAITYSPARKVGVLL